MSIETPKDVTRDKGVEQNYKYIEAIKQQFTLLYEQIKREHAKGPVSNQGGNDHFSAEMKQDYTHLEEEQRRCIDRWFGFDDPERKKLWDPKDPNYSANATIRDQWQSFFIDDWLDKTGMIKESMKATVLLFLANLALGKGSDAWIALVTKDMYQRIINAMVAYITMMKERYNSFSQLIVDKSFDEKKQYELYKLAVPDATWLGAQKINQYRSLPVQKNHRGITLCSLTAYLNAHRWGVRFPGGDAFDASCNPVLEKGLFRKCLPDGKNSSRPHDSWGPIDFTQEDLGDANMMDVYVGRYPPQVSSKWGHRACAIKIDDARYVLDPYVMIVKDGKMIRTTDPIPLAVYQKTNPILKAFLYKSQDARLG